MANTPVFVYHDLVGIPSPTLLLRSLSDSSVLNGSGVALTQGHGPEQWTAVVTQAIDGVVAYQVTSSGEVVAWGFLAMADTTEACHGEYTLAAAQARSRTEEVLTAIDGIECSGGEGGGLDADGVRAALGMTTTNLVAEIEAALIDDGDATALLQAIADKLATDFDLGDLTAATIASAVREAILDRVLSGNHDTAGTVGGMLQAISGKTSALPATPAAAGSQMSLTTGAINSIVAAVQSYLSGDGDSSLVAGELIVADSEAVSALSGRTLILNVETADEGRRYTAQLLVGQVSRQ